MKLTKRELFAAIAMQGLVSSGIKSDALQCAIVSVAIADQLMDVLSFSPVKFDEEFNKMTSRRGYV